MGAEAMRERQPVERDNAELEDLARQLDRLATHQLINAALIAGVVAALMLMTFA